MPAGTTIAGNPLTGLRFIARSAMSAASRETECCRAVAAPAFSHGNKRTQQLEFHHSD
jgi:hypothetical protein